MIGNVFYLLHATNVGCGAHVGHSSLRKGIHLSKAFYLLHGSLLHGSLLHGSLLHGSHVVNVVPGGHSSHGHRGHGNHVGRVVLLDLIYLPDNVIPFLELNNIY